MLHVGSRFSRDLSVPHDATDKILSIKLRRAPNPASPVQPTAPSYRAYTSRDQLQPKMGFPMPPYKDVTHALHSQA